MERMTKFFMSRQTLFWSLVVGILLMGVISYMRMPKLEDPAVPIKQVSVVALYPGADAHTVELTVAQPLEDALRTLPDVNKIKTECRAGQAMVIVEFKKETPISEIEQHFDIVRRKASDIALTLPQGCMEPMVIDDMMDVYGLFYAFKGDGYSLTEMEKYAKLLRRELLTVPGVKRINIGGTKSEVINIEFTPEQLKRNGLMPTQLMMALQSVTSPVDAGTVESDPTRMRIEVTEGVASAEDVADLLLDTPEGKKVRLGDVAKVTRTYTTPSRNQFFVHGEPALTMAITLDNSAIVPDVGKAVDAKMEEVMQRMPVGMETEKIFFQPDKVDEAMNGFMLNLLESVLIVVVILMIFMGWKAGFIIGFGLVLTVALSFPILSTLGTTLQRISLGAFIVAMGMLVDNSVVIMDGILVDRQRGLPRSQYLYRIGKNTAWPLLGATVIAASTFLPIYMSPGSTGEFAGDLFLVICVSLMVSWVLALIQVPVCANRWIKDAGAMLVREAETANPPGRFYRWMRRLIEWLIGHRTLATIAAICIFGAACFLAGSLRQVFFPDFDYKQFVVECYFPGVNDPEVVADRMLELADSAASNPEVERVAVSTGGAPARYCFVRPMPSGGDNYAELIIDCKDFKTMNRMTDVVRQQLRDIAPDAYIRTRHYNFSISSTHTVEVEFTGPDPVVLRQLARQAEDIMRECPLVDPYSVQNNWYPRGKELTYSFSQSAAQRAGVSRTDVGNALKAAGDGYAVGVFNDGDKMIPIQITMRNPDGTRPASLSAIPVWSTANMHLDPAAIQGMMTGASSPAELGRDLFRTTLLSNVVDSASMTWSEDFVYRYNGQRAIQAECDPDPLNKNATPAKVEAAIAERINAIQLPVGYSMRWVGEGDTSKESNEILLGFLPMMLMIIFVVLLLLFNNWRKLFVVLVCFPFVLCGIVPMLLLTDTPFTFLAILGFMGLIGMMVKNSIVLLDEITRLTTEEAVEEYEAVVRATLSRVRPVMLASFTTILGMIPLISDAMYGSLAVTVIGGLAVGTIVTLLLLPIFYSMLFRVKKPANA
jgi:multidrug efflux pump subunit AcrB